MTALAPLTPLETWARCGATAGPLLPPELTLL